MGTHIPFERYLNIRSAYGGKFSPNGKQIAFLTNITGVPQVWRIDAPGGWAHQLTFYTERITGVSWAPKGNLLVFGMDMGGNEREQLFLMRSDGSETLPLTDHPEAIHQFGGWSHDATQIAFAANRRSFADFDLYVQDVATGEARCVFEGTGYYAVVDWSPDDQQLLVSQAFSSFHQKLMLLDLASGKMHDITQDDEPVCYQGAQWAPEGNAIYFATDKDRDFLALVRYDLEIGTQQGIAAPDWDIEGVKLSKDGSLLAYVTNQDGYSHLTLCNAKTGESIWTFDLEGAIGQMDFSVDKLALTRDTPAQNMDVWLLDLHTHTLEQATFSAHAGIPQRSFIEPQLIRYATFDDRQIPAFFYLPTGAKEGETPVIVYIHGGPEGQSRPSFNPIFQYFLQRGFALFVPNVRGSTGYGKAYSHLDDVYLRMDSVKDIIAGVDWLKASRYIHPDRIAVMGGSYGGFMTLACVTQYPDLWAAGVDIVGIANFVTFLQNTGAYRRKLREPEYGSLEQDAEFLREISPIHYVDQITAPMLVIQGANDPRVPQNESDQMVEAIRQRGGVVEYILFEDEGHGVVKLPNRIRAYTAIGDFLEQHLTHSEK
ncbi:MAG: S9 family peptidase [Candidatus Poribacteria bacterium]|nr:S9 family peptidase [Candidatus Poribacteria bacterium]